MRFMKCVLVFCLAELVAFSVFACVFQCVKGIELSPTLVQWHYTVFGIELGALALLKIAEIKEIKIKKKKNKTDNETSVMEGDETDE